MSTLKMFLGTVLIICLCLFIGPALYSEDLPEEGMNPGYEPENVTVPDEKLIENTVPVDEPEINEDATLKDDESKEDSNANTFEDKVNDIQSDQKATTEDDAY